MEALVNEPTAIYGHTDSSTLFVAQPFQVLNLKLSTIFSPDRHFSKEVSRLLQKLSGIEQLEDDWDSYGASAPSATALSNARQFILENHDLALPFYFIAPGVNGEVMVEFSAENKAAELYFNPDGSTELLLFEGDEPKLTGTLEEHFRALIDFFND